MKASNNICLHFYELEHRMLNQLEKNRDWDGIGAKYTQVQEDFGQRTPGMKKRNGANEIYSTPQARPLLALVCSTPELPPPSWCARLQRLASSARSTYLGQAPLAPRPCPTFPLAHAPAVPLLASSWAQGRIQRGGRGARAPLPPWI